MTPSTRIVRRTRALALALTLALANPSAHASAASPSRDFSADPGLAAFAGGRFSEALLAWRASADAGDAAAALYLGVMYDTGTGVTPDPARALAWYERAAAEGNVTAMLNAAILHDTAHDTDAAIDWYAQAVAHGSGVAGYDLGLLFRDRGDRREAIAAFRRALALGVPAAANHLRELGVAPPLAGAKPPDDPAIVAFQRAQDLLLARGVAQAAAAVALFRQSADAGNPLAAYNLGYCFEHGLGVAADPAAALAWYRRSAAAARDAELRNVAEAGARRLERSRANADRPAGDRPTVSPAPAPATRSAAAER